MKISENELSSEQIWTWKDLIIMKVQTADKKT